MGSKYKSLLSVIPVKSTTGQNPAQLTFNVSRLDRRPMRAAFTLLEVLLALALSFMVLYAISMAINLHLRMLNMHQKEIEQSQLSRSVLRLVRDDIRGAIQYTPFDTSALEELLAGLNPASGTPDPDATVTDSTVEIEDDAPLASEVVSTSAYPPTRPGVYGNETSLSIDVSRLPRRDQLLFPVSSGLTDALPSDVKTIAYYIGEVQSAPGISSASNSNVQTGLIRREIDRAVSRFASDNGSPIDMSSAAKVIATEVTQIYFSYYDGEQWQSSWDSDELKKLPVAIQCTIQIGGEQLENNVAVSSANQLQQIRPETHQMTVYLNISEVPVEEDE